MTRLLVILIFGACSTTSTSTVGPFVRTITGGPGGIVVSTCAITYTQETTYNPIGGNNKKSEIVEGNCFQVLVPTEVSQ